MRSLFGLGKSEDSAPPSPTANEQVGPDSAVSQVVPQAIAPVFDRANGSSLAIQDIKALSDDEKQVLARIKANIPSLISDLPPVDPEAQKYVDMDVPLDIEGWLSDECIARYVRARKGVYEETKRALRKTIEWRAAVRPHALRPDAVEDESRTGKMYFNGFDKLSRPVIYMYNHRQNTKDADGQIRWVIYTLEMCIRHMPPGVEKVTLAIDAAHWGLSSSVSIGTAKKFLDTLANHYPERLGRGVIFSPPRFFVAFYSIVSPFIDPVTKSKIAFVNPSAATPAQTDGAAAASSSPWIAIEDCFERDQLEVDCYGTWTFQYNHSVYWKALEAEFAIFKAGPQLPSPPASPQPQENSEA